MQRLPRLARLDLALDRVGAAGAAALAQPLGTLTALTALHLSDNKLLDAGAEALAPALRRLTRLQKLNLSGNQVSDDGLAHLVPALACLPELHRGQLLQYNRFPMQQRHGLASAWGPGGSTRTSREIVFFFSRPKVLFFSQTCARGRDPRYQLLS